LSAFLAAACVDNGGPSAPATSSVNITTGNAQVPAPDGALLSTAFLPNGDVPSPNSTAPPASGPAQGGGSSGGGVTVIPPTGSTVTNLTNGALLVVGDTLTLVGGGLSNLGGALPGQIGSLVTLVSGVPTQMGAVLQGPNQGLDATLHGVLAATLSPLQSSTTLLAPVASGTGQRTALLANPIALVSPKLQQALAGGLTTGLVDQLVKPLLANGAPTSILAPALAGIGSGIKGAVAPVTGVLAGITTAGATTTGATMSGGAMSGGAMSGGALGGGALGGGVMSGGALGGGGMTGASPPVTAAPPITSAPPAAAPKGLIPTLVGPLINTAGGILGGKR